MRRIEGLSLVSICYNQKKQSEYLSKILQEMHSLPKTWVFVDDGSSPDNRPEFSGVEPDILIETDFSNFRNPAEPRRMGVESSSTDRVIFHSVDQIPMVKDLFDRHESQVDRGYVFSLLYNVKNFDYHRGLDFYAESFLSSKRSIDYKDCFPGFASFSKRDFEKAFVSMEGFDFGPNDGGEDTMFRRLMFDSGVEFFCDCASLCIHIDHHRRWIPSQDIVFQIDRVAKKKSTSPEPPIYLLNYDECIFSGFVEKVFRLET